MVHPNPKVFIGSSVESLPVLKVVAKALDGIADVTVWTDSKRFTKPGEYFLDSLIEAASDFDLAVLLFGARDVVTSRGKTQRAPRDNVVFELGLFMSVLGRERTIVVAPTVWKKNLKILSDLDGLNLEEFDPPRARKDLPKALHSTCERLRTWVQARYLLREQRGPVSVGGLMYELEEFLSARPPAGQSREILNLALDMEVTWRFLSDRLLGPSQQTDVSCRAQFIDWRAPAIKKAKSATVSISTARKREREILNFCRKNAARLKQRNMRFECRAYSEVPVIHGFQLDGNTLFISACGIRRGGLIGAPNPYFRLERPESAGDDEVGAHLFEVFEGWFEHHWKKGRKIWPA